MKDGLKVVTIGGGSSYTPELVDGFIKRAGSLPVRELVLVDIPEGEEKLGIIGALARRMVSRAGVDMEIKLSLDRRDALRGADFVTTQLRVGQLRARELDESIPLKHGVLGQETNGAGGMFKAFRTIPVMLDIAADINELCPDAWLINFTNPSGMVTEALFRYSPLEKVIGLCNGPIHLERGVAKLLGASPERVKILFAGLNHMVFGLSVTLDGEKINDRLIDEITSGERPESMKNVTDVSYCPEFYRSLGVLMCSYHNYYFKKDQMLADALRRFKEGRIRAREVMLLESELFEAYRDESLDVKPEALESRGGAYYSDAACRLIESIHLDRRDIQPVDTRNNGAIAGIDDDSVVEISSVITKNGPVPLNVGKLPIAVNGLVQQIKTFERLTVEAAVDGDYGKAILALTLNPLTPSDEVAKRVVDELLDAHRGYLPKMVSNKDKLCGGYLYGKGFIE